MLPPGGEKEKPCFGAEVAADMKVAPDFLWGDNLNSAVPVLTRGSS
jgi:hypothetical protein